MPSYFYHLALELFAHAQSDYQTSSKTDNELQTSLSFDSACEALLPFQSNYQKRARHTPSSRSARSLHPSSERHQCSPSPASVRASSKSSNSSDIPIPTSYQAIYTKSVTPTSQIENDSRLDRVSIECIDMVASEQHDQSVSKDKRFSKRVHTSDNPVATGIGTDILGGPRTKGRYIPLDQKTSESVWGIVHLYRDASETPYLAVDDYPAELKGSAAARQLSDEVGEDSGVRQEGGGSGGGRQGDSDDECTTLCILAVPSYLSPPDFLGFVGEATMNDVSHFRMIRTARANRYMVLMKFRSGRKAREWQRVWNGKVFNSMEVCSVTDTVYWLELRWY